MTSPLRQDALIVAKNLNVEIEFCDRLMWIGNAGGLDLVLTEHHNGSGRIVVYDEALEARYGAEAAKYLPQLLKKAFDPSEPRDEAGKWTDGGGSDGGGEGDHPGHGYSKGAYVKDGVIHTDNVYDATRALYEGRQVELHQPDEVSTLLEHLGHVTMEMARLGEKAPNFDLCKVSIKGTNLFCAESKGIPRIEMPQLDKDQTKALLSSLKKQGYEVEKKSIKADHLRATQNELVGAKVAAKVQQLTANPDKRERRIVVSKDNYILDGHHQWAGMVALDAADNKLGNLKMPVFKVNISITKLLKEAEKFSGEHVGTEDRRGYLSYRTGDFEGWEVRYDPDEPRDEAGRWTDGGGSSETGTAYEFVSPNVKTDMNFNEAVKELDSQQQDKLKDASAAIDKALKLESAQHDAIGAWADGAENSVLDAHTGTHFADWDKIALASVMKAHLADQKSVLVFQDKSAEKPRDSVTVKRPSGTSFQVEVNPVASEIRSMARESAYGVRVLIDADGNLYAWEADDAIHAQIASELNLDERYEDIWTVHKGRLISERYAGDYVEENFAEAQQEVRDRLASLHGDATLMSFQAKGDLADIHKQLLSDGLAFHTLVPQDGGATVYAAEIDPKNLQATVDAVRKAADRYGSKITYRHGRGEFIGDSLGTGSDREQRDRARAVYEDYIRRSPVYRSEAIWQGVRDNWSASADQAAKGLKAYDESQHPRGEHGRWTDAGGGSGGGKPDLLNPTGPANFQGVKAEVAMATSRVEDMFPSVPPSAIKIDGKDDPDYNCFAWACGATNQFWFPHRGYMYHWPAIEETTADDIDNFDVLFLDKLHGEEVVDQTYEPGFVKLALFTDTTEGEIYATHLSRQLPSGEWGSKLGSGYLVRHGTNIHDLDYGHYGNVEKIYKITEDAWEKLRTMK